PSCTLGLVLSNRSSSGSYTLSLHDALPISGHMNGDLTCLRCENSSLHTYDIADVHFLEFLVSFLTDIVACHVALNTALQILYITERSLSHHTFGHHTSRYGNLFFLHLLIVVFAFLTVMCHIIFRNNKRILTVLLQFLQFITAHLQ